MKKVLFILILIALAAGGWFLYQRTRPVELPPAYRTATITRHTIVQDIRATGIVQPIKQVEVGTQVNGPIIALYADFNSIVTANQIVAQIDPAVYEATHARDCAQLKSNQASVRQIEARLVLAEKDLTRKKELAERKMIAPSELDAAVAERDSLQASLGVAEAAIEQSEAAVKMSRTNLGYCTIRSPVDGVVIARNVDEGQTVVSSMSAQQLFKIATDLKRIQVEASVPEADVGLLRTGQPVTFTVDAYPHAFTGQVTQVRLASETVQSVVTYPVIIEADNPGEKLFPGMTANISVEVARLADTLAIPQAALRFTHTNDVSSIRGPKIWLLNEQNQPEPIGVKLGISDGARTALAAADQLEDREVILGIQTSRNGSSNQPKNPFMPTPPGGSPPPRQMMRAMR